MILGAKPTPKKEESKSIHDVLTNVDSLLKLTDDELRKLFEPYIPATRKALLPEEKPSKLGLHTRVMKDFMNDPNIKAQLEALKANRK